MKTRRKFIVGAGITGLGAALLHDPFLKALAALTNARIADVASQFSHSCEIIRSSDFLHLRFYFINLRLQGNRLQKISGDLPAFFLARVAQQHSAEEYKEWRFDTNCDIIFPTDTSQHFSRSFLAGYSHLTFQLPSGRSFIEYNDRSLLDWNKFDLVTIQQLATYPRDVPVQLSTSSGSYPVNGINVAGPLTVARIGGIMVPITMFEAPYKMLLSPIHPYMRPSSDTDYRFQFSNNNQPQVYFQAVSGVKRTALTALWNNDLFFQITSDTQGVRKLPPNFKIVGFEKSDPIPQILPNGLDRSNLAELTNVQEDKRDIESKYFNISSLGASTFLSYYNLNEEIGGVSKAVVNYKHDMKLGRDNYVEVSEKAIDLRSGLKLIYTRITERRIEKGKSLLVYRLYFKYLEREKNYADGFRFNNYVFKKIIAVSEGTFFVKIPMAGVDPRRSWIVGTECGPTTVVKMPYKGIDSAGRVIDFEMDVTMMPKTIQNGGSNELNFTRQNFESITPILNDIIAKNPKDHEVRLDKIKIAYVPPSQEEPENPDGDKKNNELVTEALQFYSTWQDEFESDYPIIPHVKYAEVYVPQLEGVQTTPKTYFVNYAETFLDNGLEAANKTKVFLRTLNEKIKDLPLQKVKYEEILAEFKQKHLKSITNVFTENYKNIGSMLNPDVVIDNLSILKQGITFTEDMNRRVESIRNVNPADLLRGINAEIMGGIDLKKILKHVLPLADAPVFEMLDQATDGFQQVAEFAAEFKTISDRVKSVTTVLQELQDSLADSFTDKLKGHIDKLNEKNSKLVQMGILLNRKLNTTDPATLILGRPINVVMKEKRMELEANLRQAFTQNPSPFPAQLIDIKNKIDNFFNAGGAAGRLVMEVIALKQILVRIEEEIKSLQSSPGGLPTTAAARLQKLIEMKAAFNRVLLVNNFLSAKYTAIINSYKANFQFAKDQLKETGDTIMLLISSHFHSYIGQAVAVSNQVLSFRDGLSKTLGELLREETIILANNTFAVLEDLSPWFEMLNEYSNELTQNKEELVEFYKMQVNALNGVVEEASTYLEKEMGRLENELIILRTQVSRDIKQEMDSIGAAAIKKFTDHLLVRDVYTFMQSVYLEFNQLQEKAKKYHEQYRVMAAYVASFPAVLGQLENDIKTVAKGQLNRYKSNLEAAVQARINEVLASIDQTALRDTVAYIEQFKNADELAKRELNKLYQRVDAEKQRMLEQIDAKKKELFAFRDELKNFLKNKLAKIEQDLKDSNRELIDAYNEGEAAVQAARARIRAIQEKIEMIRSLNKKEFKYTWTTDKFDDVNLGILKFLKGRQAPTTLTVDMKNTLHFSLREFPPRLDRVEVYSNTRLSNFTINFLSIISVEFESVSFVAGNEVKEKFDVLIRDVRFDGPLNFVQVFQSYLKTLDKGLRLDISAAGATLGYDLTLPDITGGAFNFTNAALAMDLRLPFRAGVPMRFTFGLNSPGNMFLLTAGIFGGRGCFQIAVEPKRGVVMILLIIEFGGVLYLNIGVAKGIVYLFAGIYIRKEYDKVEINGYLTCGGALDIIGLITASVTFYLGLRGSGKYMEGYCTITYTIKICAFVEIDVGLSMYKRVYGSPDNSQTNGSNGVLLALKEDGTAISSSDPMDIEEAPPLTPEQWRNLFESYFPM